MRLSEIMNLVSAPIRNKTTDQKRSGRVFVNSLNHVRIDIVEQHIVHAIVAIRSASKRPDA